MDEDNSKSQSHMNSFDQDKFLTQIVHHPPNFPFQSFLHSSTMQYNNIFTTTTTNTIDTSLSYEDASYDEKHGSMLKSTSSNSLISVPSPSTFILSFEKSSVEPALHHDRPNSPKNFGGDATSSSIMGSKRTLSNHITKPNKQGTKKFRSSSEIQDHIMAERKRRQELTERFIALSATIPGLKKVRKSSISMSTYAEKEIRKPLYREIKAGYCGRKKLSMLIFKETDKAYILREAIIYMKQLQERVKELEHQSKRKRTDSVIFIKKSQVCSKEAFTNSYNGIRSPTPLPQVEARVLEKEVLIGIHCEKQKDIVLKIMTLLQNLHLSLASSSVLPFGTSTLKVTIIAQMGDKYCTTVNDLVKNLRQDLLKSYAIQKHIFGHLMASWDEEGEIVLDFVDIYWFENDKEEFVSLSSLKLLWSISEILDHPYSIQFIHVMSSENDILNYVALIREAALFHIV
ncbi:hypothetical protein VNO77_09204 [Canavalia gladiata]|uniref:BHLH domain-containing protein n=1 Tax=Canavalia gladiata TaxID=3824 RepID=A0AAN9QWG3_CANGL